MELAEWQLLLQALIVILGLYLAFFKSYFQEKGKNIATKEDIEEITSKVETIRHEMHFSTESKLSIRMEERNALVEYFTKYHYWLNTILDVSPSDIDEKDDGVFDKIQSILYKAKFDFDMAKAKLEIFVENQNILDLEQKTILGALAIQHLVLEVMLELKQIHFKISVTRQNPDPTTQLEEYKMNLAEKQEILRKFNEAKLGKYKEVLEDCSVLRKIVYDHIKTLIEV